MMRHAPTHLWGLGQTSPLLTHWLFGHHCLRREALEEEVASGAAVALCSRMGHSLAVRKEALQVRTGQH